MISTRLNLILKHFNMSQTEIGKLVGVAPSTVSQYVKGTVKPSMSVMRAISREFNVSMSWLETGEGEMIDHTHSKTEIVITRKTQLSKTLQILTKIENGKMILPDSALPVMDDLLSLFNHLFIQYEQ